MEVLLQVQEQSVREFNFDKAPRPLHFSTGQLVDGIVIASDPIEPCPKPRFCNEGVGESGYDLSAQDRRGSFHQCRQSRIVIDIMDPERSIHKQVGPVVED